MFITMVTGHGKVKDHLHQLHIIDNSISSCKMFEQIIDHILYGLHQLLREKQLMLPGAARGVVGREELGMGRAWWLRMASGSLCMM